MCQIEHFSEVSGYAAARSDIRDGDVLAWTYRKGWFSSWYSFQVNLVRLFTRSEYSHVGIAVWVDGRLMVLESVTPTVRLVPLSDELPAYVLAGGTPPMTPQQRARGFRAIGTARYSKLDAVLAYIGLNKPDDRWSCAEFVTYVLDLSCRATPSAVVRTMLGMGAVMIELRRGS